MLLYTLVNIPGLSPAVLDVLFTHTDPLVASRARLRAGWANPFDPFKRLAPSLDDLTYLLADTTVTDEQWTNLLNSINLDALEAWVTTRNLTGPQLVALTEYIVDIHPDPPSDLTWWAIQIAANPNTPIDHVWYVLTNLVVWEDVAPAEVVAVIDTHNLNPARVRDILPVTPAGPIDRLTAILAAYETAGNLLNLLENTAPCVRSGETHLSWKGVAAWTTNPDVLIEIARRATTATSTTARVDFRRALREAVWNRRVPAPTFAAVARILYAHPSRVPPDILEDATLAVARNPADLTGELLNLAVATACGTAIWHLLDRPDLTTDKLRTLISRADTDAFLISWDQRSVLALAALHPNANDDVRSDARAKLRSVPTDVGQAQLDTTGVIEHLACNEHVPASAIFQDAGSPTLLPDHVARTFLDQHPQLLTNPDVVHVTLALAPQYAGSLDELVTTATTIASS